MTPRHRFVRLVAALAGVLLLGATAAACSDSLSDAATADDTHIPRDEFNTELEHLVANDAFVDLLSQGGQYTFSDDKNEIGTSLASTWLSLRLRQVVIDDEFEARNLEVTDELRTQARAAVDESYGGKAIVDKFDPDFRATLVERQARTLALTQAMEDEEPTEADARAFYEANRDALYPCQTNRTVSHIVVSTEAEAQAVLDELADGAEFADLVQDRSIDAASREQGGVITNSSVPPGCYPAGVSTELDTAVQSAALNEPTAPVQTGSGYEVLLVEPYEPPSFDEVGDELQQQLAADPQARLLVLQDRRLRELDVTVDPRFGAWVIDDQGARVEPPDEPKVRESRTPKVTPPTATPFGGVPGA